jgi:hypothetical protein
MFNNKLHIFTYKSRIYQSKLKLLAIFGQSRVSRSAFAKFWCGVASLRIETGRFENFRIEERICCFCSDFIEDEDF